jgi:hypothetical protein
MYNKIQSVAEYNKSSTGTRVVSDYKNDMIFEQPRDNLLQQEFTSFEYTDKGIKRSTTVRKYKKNGDYNDITSIEFIGS